MKRLRPLVASMLLVVGLLNGTARPSAADCGPYPFEFASLCPGDGVMLAVCRSDGAWEFVGCWYF